ncbi:hypothetical protein JOF29_002965 [Kribbella aluminosa]|uniref:Uncharacterized protein n=1 Tax=Kribbella aluminosa TaxID=416017 RepID=A0ABS4UJR0_9ACTN|nr:hypothetical protein [Kribbella aluminosa]
MCRSTDSAVPATLLWQADAARKPLDHILHFDVW